MLSLHAKGYSSQQLSRHAAAPPASRQSESCCGSGRPEAFLCCCSVSFCCKEGCRVERTAGFPQPGCRRLEHTRIRKSSYAERYNMITRFAARKSNSPRANQRSLCRAITAALQYTHSHFIINARSPSITSTHEFAPLLMLNSHQSSQVTHHRFLGDYGESRELSGSAESPFVHRVTSFYHWAQYIGTLIFVQEDATGIVLGGYISCELS